jgi:hypothetical protein
MTFPSRRILGWGVALVLAGCSHSAPDATPDGAVRLWLDRMEMSSEDPRAIKDAYALLGPSARANLEERARRTGQLQGQRVEPYVMLADGRFGLRFRPKAMKASISGDQATVEVTGYDPTDHASIRCVHEVNARGVGGWRVEPELPEPQPAAPRR